jgi:hypothetical protein
LTALYACSKRAIVPPCARRRRESARITSADHVTGSGAGELPAAFIDAVSSVIDPTISASDDRRASQIRGCRSGPSGAFGASGMVLAAGLPR